MATESVCPVCTSPAISVFFEISDVPVHVGLQWPTQDAARHCPKGDIRLASCRACGCITNLAFKSARLEYTEAYENPLHFSPFFQEYARSLAERLIERYDVRNKDVIEIGCGKGDFLLLLCELGNNRGVGFDPSYESQRTDAQKTKRISFIRDFYSERYACYKADFICCRFVFEHIHNPTDFLTMLRRTIGDRSNTVVYFEVPNVLSILRDLSIWDIIYEHCSYFSSESLARVFASCGFEVRDVNECYGSQFVSIEASPSKGVADSGRDRGRNSKQMTDYVASFAANYRGKMETWQSNLDRIWQAGRRAVVWGAGAKAVSFLNMLKIEDQIEYVVDINPHKQGKHIAGTGQQIVAPEFLRDYQPDVVIVMNPLYDREIRQIIRNLGLATEVLCPWAAGTVANGALENRWI